LAKILIHEKLYFVKNSPQIIYKVKKLEKNIEKKTGYQNDYRFSCVKKDEYFDLS